MAVDTLDIERLRSTGVSLVIRAARTDDIVHRLFGSFGLYVSPLMGAVVLLRVVDVDGLPDEVDLHVRPATAAETLRYQTFLVSLLDRCSLTDKSPAFVASEQEGGD